jgi:hypothetical protein
MTLLYPARLEGSAEKLSLGLTSGLWAARCLIGVVTRMPGSKANGR